MKHMFSWSSPIAIATHHVRLGRLWRCSVHRVPLQTGSSGLGSINIFTKTKTNTREACIHFMGFCEEHLCSRHSHSSLHKLKQKHVQCKASRFHSTWETLASLFQTWPTKQPCQAKRHAGICKARLGWEPPARTIWDHLGLSGFGYQLSSTPSRGFQSTCPIPGCGTHRQSPGSDTTSACSAIPSEFMRDGTLVYT